MNRALSIALFLAAVLLPAWVRPATAEPPRVVTDTVVVHALAAQVMAGVGTPDLLVTGSSDPHHVTLRPSEAARLAEADLVFWVGPDLTPWLADALVALAPGTSAPPLLSAPGATVLRYGFSDAAPVDPHAWLDPANARAWVRAIAAELSREDPANAAQYAANATATEARLDALQDDLAQRLAPVRDRPIVVLHDAYGYLARAFGLRIIGAALLGDGTGAGAQRLARLAAAAEAGSIACAFAEPGRPDGVLRAALAGTDIPLGSLDPEGTALIPGPDLYDALMRGLADALSRCVAPPT
jgi:zinc transport system substrate-binding protein